MSYLSSKHRSRRSSLRTLQRLVVPAAFLGALACSLLDGSKDNSEDGATSCSEGETRACEGNQGCHGFATCNANGDLGNCVCTSGGTGGRSGGGMGCGDLADCCNSTAFPAAARDSCLAVVDFGDEATCSAAVGQYEAANFCGSGSGTGGAGGTTSAGGAGGTTNVGGAGGTTGVGGTTSAGGTTGVGGTTSAGGAPTGGVSGAANGGVGNVAGTSTAGSSTGGGAGTPSCGASFSALSGGYVTAPGSSGCWRGYAYTGASGASSTITPANYSTCGTPCMLCANGSVAPDVSYSGIAMVGFNLNQAADATTSATVTPTGTNMVVNYTNTTGAPLRVQIVGATGDTVATDRWCVTLPVSTTGPVSIPYANFNTECWVGGAGTAYAKQPIKAVQLLVPGGNMTSIPFNMCLTSVADM